MFCCGSIAVLSHLSNTWRACCCAWAQLYFSMEMEARLRQLSNARPWTADFLGPYETWMYVTIQKNSVKGCPSNPGPLAPYPFDLPNYFFSQSDTMQCFETSWKNGQIHTIAPLLQTTSTFCIAWSINETVCTAAVGTHDNQLNYRSPAAIPSGYALQGHYNQLHSSAKRSFIPWTGYTHQALEY